MNYPDPEGYEAHCDRMGDDASHRWDDEPTVVDDFAAARAAVDDLFHAADGGAQWTSCALCGEPDAFPPSKICSSCKTKAAADGGEENETMMNPDKLMECGSVSQQEAWETTLAMLLGTSSDLQLKQARYAIDREAQKRVEAAKATIRAFDPDAPKPRKIRSDANKPRAPKAENDGERQAS